MSELTDVLAAIDAAHARGERMALATIVATRGSTYRRPGARLFVPERGASVGNISGGCLEGEVERIGREVMADGVSRLVPFDLTADDDAVWGFGLGCSGAVEIFIEAGERAASTAAALRVAVEGERECCVVTVVASSLPGVAPGDRLVVTAGGARVGGLGDRHAEGRLVELAARALAADAEARSVTLDAGRLRAFLEPLRPPPRLLVCGAGHDAIPLVRAAAELGWRPTVTDVRSRLLTQARFPGASGFIHAPPAAGVERFAADARSAIVVMSHNYLKDIEYLRAALELPAGYLGVLGPRLRTEQLLREIGREEALDRLHAPAGLDLGAEGPYEVALAIIAEMLAARRGRCAGFLRDRRGPIHEVADRRERGRYPPM